MKATEAQLAHRREIHAEAIAKADKPKRMGRPPLPHEQRTRKRNYSIRLTPEHIAELQKRGTKALEAWLSL